MIRLFIALLYCSLLCIMAGCGNTAADQAQEAEARQMAALYGENRELPAADSTLTYAVKTCNGFFVGKIDDGVVSYKGIPYAEPPVGPLRWHSPVAAAASSRVREAYYFGYSSIQTRGATQRASYYPQSEDCLTLNVWTAPADSAGAAGTRPVMVYIHGGSYGWGGTSDPMFEGHNLVKNHPDIVLVTINYRLGIFGFLDLTNLKGGENYTESANLGILDQIEALKWVRKNIARFGGDSANVTIFGESAGGGSVSLLAVIDRAKGLFRRAIAESGSVALSSSKAEARELTDMLVKETGIDSVGQLMRLTTAQLEKINVKLSAHNRFPMRDGVLIPLDPYKAYREGKARDIDFLSGTNRDEVRYWVGSMGGYVPFKVAINVWYENIMAPLPPEQQKIYDKFTDEYPGGRTMGRVEFFNDLMFRVPSTLTVSNHSESGGSTYNYLWTKASALPHRGACHTVELAYVFGNLDQTIYTGGPVDPQLSATVQDMWTNFARTGNPGTGSHPWPQYDPHTRQTMILGDSIGVADDILGEQYGLIEPLAPRFISPLYDTISLNVPYVRGILAVAFAVIAAVITAVILWRRRHKRRRQVQSRRS